MNTIRPWIESLSPEVRSVLEKSKKRMNSKAKLENFALHFYSEVRFSHSWHSFIKYWQLDYYDYKDLASIVPVSHWLDLPLE
jgi:hypothetical protein